MTSEKDSVKLTCVQAKECLKTILGWVRNDDPQNSADGETSQLGSVESAREAAGNDMVALMSRVYPIIAQLTAQAVGHLGYSLDGTGVLQFERAVQALMPQDPELARLHSELRSYYLPAIVFPAPHTITTTA